MELEFVVNVLGGYICGRVVGSVRIDVETQRAEADCALCR